MLDPLAFLFLPEEHLNDLCAFLMVSTATAGTRDQRTTGARGQNITERTQLRPFPVHSNQESDPTTATPTRSLYTIYFSQLKAYWSVYLVGLLALLAGTCVEIASPKLIQWAVDLLTLSASTSNSTVAANHTLVTALPQFLREVTPRAGFRLVLLLVAIGMAVQWLSRRFWRLSLGYETHRVSADMKSALWRRVRLLPAARLSSKLTKGVLMNVATGDIGTARFMFGWTLIGLLDSLLIMSFALVMMISIDLTLSMAILACLAYVPFATYHRSKRGLSQYLESQESLSELNDLTAQAVATVKLQRLGRTEAHWAGQLLKAAELFRVRRLKESLTFLGLYISTGLPPVASYACLLVLGLRSIQNGNLSLGEFVALQGYMLLLIHPLIELGFVIAEWQKSTGSLSRVLEILDEPVDEALHFPANPVEAIPATCEGVPAIELRNLSFSYSSDPDSSDSERSLISGLSLSLKPGERLGVYGPVGSGKSTLLEIMGGLQRGFSGEVFLFGEDIRRYPNSALRPSVSMVQQQPFLFADSVRNNVMLGDVDYQDEELNHFLTIAGLAEDVAQLPNGLDTQLGEWGVNLSGGQKQRLTLARALASRPRVLLLDDCLSAVDTVTEERILKALDEHLKDTTLIWVAHRSSTLRYCDQVLKLDENLHTLL